MNKIIIQDEPAHRDVQLEDVKKIAYAIENYQYHDCLEILKNLEYISLKNYKKIMKKYK